MTTLALNKALLPFLNTLEKASVLESDVTATSVAKPLSLGRTVSAVVLNRLAEDRLLAVIEGQAYNFRLPVSVHIGQAMQLEVIAEQPQLMFRLLSTLPTESANVVNTKLTETVVSLRSAIAAL